MKATTDHVDTIWSMLQQGIQRRKADGSNQWQDGYPNKKQVQSDIENEIGYIVVLESQIVGYFAISISDEDAYDNIIGEWQTNSDYVVFHRVVIDEKHLGKGIAGKMMEYVETFATKHKINSIRVDTNFDNKPMLYLFNKYRYVYCGKVYFRGSERLAYEKIL